MPRKRWNCDSLNHSDKESCFYFSPRARFQIKKGATHPGAASPPWLAEAGAAPGSGQPSRTDCAARHEGRRSCADASLTGVPEPSGGHLRSGSIKTPQEPFAVCSPRPEGNRLPGAGARPPATFSSRWHMWPLLFMEPFQQVPRINVWKYTPLALLQKGKLLFPILPEAFDSCKQRLHVAAERLVEGESSGRLLWAGARAGPAAPTPPTRWGGGCQAQGPTTSELQPLEMHSRAAIPSRPWHGLALQFCGTRGCWGWGHGGGTGGVDLGGEGALKVGGKIPTRGDAKGTSLGKEAAKLLPRRWGKRPGRGGPWHN